MEVSLAAAVPVAEVVITPAGRGEVSKTVAVTAGGRIVILATPVHVQALAWRKKKAKEKEEHTTPRIPQWSPTIILRPKPEKVLVKSTGISKTTN